MNLISLHFLSFDEKLVLTVIFNLYMQGHSRCYKGHSGPVTALSDKLLGDGEFKVLATGGEDCTIRLWSMNTRAKKHPLVSTLHGHEKTLSLLSVAWYVP